ncbi:MAG TPA: beta-ketoacyl-ACP synthase III [Thermodesulfobacteriota bacterium]|nr:beta-ketoacyl-ACP synthase III [Thermodesulfobacteriota bacterium]
MSRPPQAARPRPPAPAGAGAPLRSVVVGTGSAAPARVLTNADLERMVNTSDEWIRTRTGIRCRRIAAPDEATSDLAAAAARPALEAAGLDPAELELIVVATATPDMLFPSTACVLQAKLGAERAAAFDLLAACTGYIYALQVADGLLRAGLYRNALVVGAETLSKVVDFTDRNTCVIFGDGAGATVLVPMAGERGVLSSHLHADGRYGDLVQIPGGGSRIPASVESVSRREHFIKMRGNETYKIAVRRMEETVLEALAANRVRPGDVDWVAPHQANLRIIEAVVERLGIPMEKVILTLEEYGNTSAACIPMALDLAARDGRLKPGDLVLLVAFGGGLTWGSALLRW